MSFLLVIAVCVINLTEAQTLSIPEAFCYDVKGRVQFQEGQGLTSVVGMASAELNFTSRNGFYHFTGRNASGDVLIDSFGSNSGCLHVLSDGSCQYDCVNDGTCPKANNSACLCSGMALVSPWFMFVNATKGTSCLSSGTTLTVEALGPVYQGTFLCWDFTANIPLQFTVMLDGLLALQFNYFNFQVGPQDTTVPTHCACPHVNSTVHLSFREWPQLF